MKANRYLFIFIILTNIIFFSCQQDDINVAPSGVEFILSPGMVGDDGARMQQDEDGFPTVEEGMCNLLYAAYAKVEIEGMEEELTLPIKQWGSTYKTNLVELSPGTYSVISFVVYDNDDEAVFATPSEDSPFENFVKEPLPVEFTVSQYQKTKYDIEVLCVEEFTPPQFGFTYWDINLKATKNLCILANYCEPHNGHQVAELVAWVYSLDDEGEPVELIWKAESQGSGDILCLKFPYNPDIQADEQEFFVDLDINGVIYSGTISLDYIDQLMEEETGYLHLNENCDGIYDPFEESAIFPDQIPLPNGFSPEGIVKGKGTDFYVGSLLDGAIYKGNLRTGEGSVFIPGEEGKVAVGLGFDKRSNYLYVAGGGTGSAYVYDALTGQQVTTIELNNLTNTFINDVAITKDAAYFTDSFRPIFYRIPLGPGGKLSDPVLAEEVPLDDDFEFIPGGFNGNGIVATPNGKNLIIANSAAGKLYYVDPMTGDALEIDLGGDSAPNVDGLVLEGKILYAVQNFLNQIAVIELSANFTSGEIVDTITDPEFKIPTTATRFGNSLYAVNARFDIAPPGSMNPDIEFDVIRVDISGY